jgi:HD superfamily phosphohydrolase
MYQFRDPVHGFIDVSELECKIINTSAFQRLRNIKQLATTYQVYHGAEHTRFGHSLGVMHLVTKAFASVTGKHPNLFKDNCEENGVVVLWYRQVLRLIALTHDLGHAPFSHVSEDLFEKSLAHEDYTKKIIMETDIADYINLIGTEFQKQYGKQYKITPELIWMIYHGDVVDEEYVMPDFKFLQGFMDSELDCDKMDYLLRDSMFCGVSYGKYDLERFISTLTVYKNNNKMKLAIEKGGIQAFEEFVLARYFMFIQVYFHKTRRYFDNLLVKCLMEILDGGKYPLEIQKYLEWDDIRVLSEINKSDSEILRQYKDRITMSCIYETTAHADTEEGKNYKMIYNLLKKELDTDKIYCNEVDKAAHKLQPIFMVTNDDSDRAIIVIDEKTGSTKNVMDESLILKGIMEPISIKRIYVTKDIAEKAKDIIQKIQS